MNMNNLEFARVMMDSTELTRLIMTNQGMNPLIRDLENLTIEERRQLDEQRQLSPPLLPGQFRRDEMNEPFELVVHASECQSPDCERRLCDLFRRTLAGLRHVTQCPKCEDTYCNKIRNVYRHGISCNKLAVGERCVVCKKMWQCLLIHAHVCKDPVCGVPCCRALKQQLQSDSPRDDGTAPVEAAGTS